MRSTLTSGAWVEHTPIQELKGKHKRLLERVGRPQPVYRDGELDREATLSGLDIMAWQEAKRDAIWAMVIGAWSYDLPVPEVGDGAQVTGAEAFGELPIGDFEELERLMAPFEAALQRKPDPKAPAAATTSSSNGSSRANAAPSPTG